MEKSFSKISCFIKNDKPLNLFAHENKLLWKTNDKQPKHNIY